MKCAIGYVQDPQTRKCIVPKPASPLNSGASDSISRYVIIVLIALVVAGKLRR